MNTYSDHLESITSLPPYEREPVRCGNCDTITPESELELIEVHKPFTKFYMRVCERCARPIQLDLVEPGEDGLWWIYYVTGIGETRKVIEATGSSIQETLDAFQEKYQQIMDRDLLRYAWR